MTPSEFSSAVRRNAGVAALLDRLPHLGLPQCHLVGGCLVQTVWNLAEGRPPDSGIRDFDVFYWDADTSWEAEDGAIRRAAPLSRVSWVDPRNPAQSHEETKQDRVGAPTRSCLAAELGLALEIRNQARVHLWYERRFGTPCPPLGSARAGIDRFLVAGTAVGIAADTGEVYAPFGLDDLAKGLLRINPRHPRPALFRAKAEDYRARWPWLRIVEPG